MSQTFKTDSNTISEYGLIGLVNRDEEYLKDKKFKSICVNENIYKELEEFAKTDSGKDVLGFSGNGKYLQAKNYVGVVQTVSGFTLEILPKIYVKENEETQTKEIFLRLLTILYKLPNYKHTNSANFDTQKKPILEIFITMFLNEVSKIIKRGLKSDYQEKEDNEQFLKGKLLINKHLKHNYIHKERFYVAYDEYTQNRVENRVLKSTLTYLLGISSSFENQRLIRIYLEYFYNVDFSFNYKSDFQRCITYTRGMKVYENALIWAKVFLQKNTFSSFQGDTIAFALLYPMEKLFENYVEYYLINRYKKCNNIQILAQSEKEFVNNLFQMKPDFLIRRDDDILVVADAKWKIINKDAEFSQSDFYQLFAYAKIFQPKKALRLYYPKSRYFNKSKMYDYNDSQTKIMVIPLDMTDILEKNIGN